MTAIVWRSTWLVDQDEVSLFLGNVRCCFEEAPIIVAADRGSLAALVAALSSRWADRTRHRDRLQDTPACSRNEEATPRRRYCSSPWPLRCRPRQPKPTRPCHSAVSRARVRETSRSLQSRSPHGTHVSLWPMDRLPPDIALLESTTRPHPFLPITVRLDGREILVACHTDIGRVTALRSISWPSLAPC